MKVKISAPGLILFCLALVALTGCWRGATSPRPPWHPNPNMDRQPKYLPQAASAFFYDGATMRQPVEGTVARGELREDTAFYTGLDSGGEFIVSMPIDADLLSVSANRYRLPKVFVAVGSSCSST